MAAHFKSKCARPLMAQPYCKLGALRVRIERAVVLILNYVLTSMHDTYTFEGDVIFLLYHML